MQKHTNFQFIKYLNYCDTLNKFNYLSLYAIPKHIEIQYKSFIYELHFEILKNLQMKSELLFLLYGFSTTYLNLCKIRFGKRKNRRVYYSAQVYFSITKKRIWEELFNLSFLLEISSNLTHLSFSPKHALSHSSGKLKYQYISLVTFLPAFCLIEQKEQNKHVNFKDLKIFIDFKFKIPFSSVLINFFNNGLNVNHSNLVKNNVLMWIFN